MTLRIKIHNTALNTDIYTNNFKVESTCNTWFTSTTAIANGYQFAVVNTTEATKFVAFTGSTYSKTDSAGATTSALCAITYSLEYVTSNLTSPFTYAAYTGTDVEIDTATGDIKVNRNILLFL